MKKTLAGVAASTLALGGMLVATAAPASAHTPTVTASCDSLHVDLKSYPDATVTVTIDDREVASEDFQGSFDKTFTFDGSTSHSWEVVVDAHDDDTYDKTYPETGAPGLTDPCPGAEPDVDEAQVGIYLYEKLDADPANEWSGKDKDARWENSGLQTLLGTKTLPLPAQKDGSYWYDELPNPDLVAELLADADVCTDWGIQQDLVSGGPDEYTMPQNITFPDGSSMDGHLVDHTHQELEDLGVVLPSGEACGEPAQPPVEEDEVVVPVAPAAVTVCGADSSDIELPVATEEVTYLASDAGVIATPTAGHTFGDDLAGYVVNDNGDAVFPLEDLLPSAEDCALVPGDIAAVCESEVPYLAYEVNLPEGAETDEETPLTVTFLNPDGDDHVVTDLPLDGRLLWPGASDTAPLQWPGWEQLEDGSYVETDGNYAWTREGVEVLFEVNPTYSTIVEYPEASTQCANPVGTGGADVIEQADDTPPAPAEVADAGPELARTGATVGAVAGVAALLLGGGATLFWLRRRMRNAEG